MNKKSIKELAQELGLKERRVRKFIESEKQKKMKIEPRGPTGAEVNSLTRPRDSTDKVEGLVKIIQYVALFGLFFLLLLFCVRTESAVDLGVHIKTGEKILLEKSMTYSDPFTFTVSSHEYLALSWLFQIIVFFIWHNAGMLGVILLNCLAVLAAFYVLYKTCSLFGHNLSITLALILMVLLICQARFYTRPELFSYLFFNAVLYILYQCKKGNNKFMWLLVVIHFLWTNFHGYFIFGLILLSCFLISELIDKKKIAKGTLFCIALSIAACFINPYGFKWITHLFTTLIGLKGSVYLKTIGELLPPFSGLKAGPLPFLSPISLYGWLIAISLLGILLNFKKQSFFNVSIYIVFLILSLRVMRNVPWFCFVAVPMTVWNFTQVGSSLPNFKYLKIFEMFMLMGIALFIIMTSCAILTNHYYIKDRRGERFRIGISEGLPFKAVEFVKTQKLKGNMFNHFDFGSYLIWQLFPGHKVFIDARTEVMGDEHYNYYIQSMAREDLWEDCVNRYNINWVITSSRQTEFLQMLYKNKDWALVYFDETAVIFVKDTSENSEVLKNKIQFEENYRVPADLEEKAFRSLELFWASTNPIERFLNHFFLAQKFPLEYINKGNLIASLGYPNQAAEQYLKALLEGPEYWESLFNLGIVYYLRGEYKNAIYCFSRVLEINPHQEGAREWLAKSGSYLAR